MTRRTQKAFWRSPLGKAVGWVLERWFGRGQFG